MKKKCEQQCEKDATHKQLGLCELHYSLHRKEQKRVALINRELEDPDKKEERLQYQKEKYYSSYRKGRLVNKLCACGLVAMKGSRHQLCSACSQVHSKTHKIEYQSERKKNHLLTKIRENIKSRLKRALFKKEGSIQSILGCTIEEFKFHLESSFYPNSLTREVMNWDNYGFYGWHIDHIRPLSDFDPLSEDDLKQASHYSNLQPLWAKDNLKKSDKYDKKKD